MFTGIIEATAPILEKTNSGLTIERPEIFGDLKIGSSIAVSGVCLTVTGFDDHSMHFDVVLTTFQKSKLGGLRKDDKVNLERAMRADGRFEGHVVQGHCEGIGHILISPAQAPTPDPSPGPRCGGAAGGGESGGFNRLLGRAVRGVGSLHYPARSTVVHARAMRKQPTDAEEKLWQVLRGNKVNGLYFRRQRPIGPFIVDFYCETLKLAVEIDGGFHQESGVRAKDQEREEYLRRRGIRCIRCTNEDVLYRMNTVLDLIKSSASLPRLTEGERSEPEVPGEGSRVGARAEGGDTGESEESVVGARTKGGAVVGEISSPGRGLGVGARVANDSILTLEIPDALLPLIVPHGSLTLDGVALTVASLEKNLVSVALIPHTLSGTTLGSLKNNDPVNIETDILGKYILSTHDRL